MLAMKYIDTLREMTTGKDNKTVYIPYEASSVLSSLGSIRTLFNDKACGRRTQCVDPAAIFILKQTAIQYQPNRCHA